MLKALMRITAVALTLLFVFVVLCPDYSPAKIIPLRSGTVLSKKDAKAYSYIEAVDQQGKNFWVLTAICVIGEGGTIEVLSGTHYDEIRSEVLDTVFKDVYTAQRLVIGGQELDGFGGHGLPEGCVTAR